jgi:hypothetical protein
LYFNLAIANDYLGSPDLLLFPHASNHCKSKTTKSTLKGANVSPEVNTIEVENMEAREQTSRTGCTVRSRVDDCGGSGQGIGCLPEGEETSSPLGVWVKANGCMLYSMAEEEMHS